MPRKSELRTFALSTDVFHPRENLFDFLEKSLAGELLEGTVLAITSKIISLAEGRIVAKESIAKKDLIQREADHYLCEGGFGTELTIKHGVLIPSSGIDESNSESGGYILYPEKPFASAESIGRHFKNTFQLNNFGVLLTDSHSMPLRKGVTGFSLAHWGFKGVVSLVGEKDIFGKPLKFTHVDVADSLAAAAVLCMGEARERTPLAVLTSPQIQFTEASSEAEIRIDPRSDIYTPLFKSYLR